MNKSDFFDQQIYTLEEDLQEMLIKAEKLIKRRFKGTSEIVQDLMLLNTKQSKMLASDIIDIRTEMLSLEEEKYYEPDMDSPYIELYNEDDELS